MVPASERSKPNGSWSNAMVAGAALRFVVCVNDEGVEDISLG
jgi:hypothetical protein